MTIHYRSLLVILTTASLLAGCSLKPQQSLEDAEMIRQFQEHKADFETLRLMLKEDKHLDTIYHDGSFRGDGVSDARIAEYLALLQRAGLKEQLVSSRFNQDSHSITISFGAFDSGRYTMLKDYVYSTKELTPLKSALDVGNQGWPEVGQRWYRKIERNWYLSISNAGSD